MQKSERESLPRIVRWEHFHQITHNHGNSSNQSQNNGDDFRSFDEDDNDSFEFTDVKIVPVAITPAGPMPISMDNGSSFNLWILHSNFKLSKSDVKTICNVDGIEAVTVFSRYRLRILIGELFDSDTVMRNVEESLGCEINYSKDIELTDELIDRIELVKETLKGDHFLIYALPNGQLKSFSSKELGKEFANHIDVFEKTYDAVGGYLLISPNLSR